MRKKQQGNDLFDDILRRRLRAHGWKDGEQRLGAPAWRDPDGKIVLHYDALRRAELLPDAPEAPLP